MVFRLRKYLPDFFIYNTRGKIKCIIEAKGRFTAADRKKMLEVRKEHPEVEFKMMFMRDNKLSKSSKIKYSKWCEGKNYDYVVGTEAPKEWL